MTGTSTGSARQLVFVVGGLLVAIGIGVVIGYASFSGSSAGDASEAEGDRELACVALDQLPDESFAKLAEEGIGPDLFRLNAIGSHATAAGDPDGEEDSWYAVGMDLVQAANTLDDEKGNEALDRVRDLCADL